MSIINLIFFFFNDTATTEIYTLSLHDALPISGPAARRWAADRSLSVAGRGGPLRGGAPLRRRHHHSRHLRSEEHTSELQSRQYLVCRLLLEKKKNTQILIMNMPIQSITTYDK